MSDSFLDSVSKIGINTSIKCSLDIDGFLIRRLTLISQIPRITRPFLFCQHYWEYWYLNYIILSVIELRSNFDMYTVNNLLLRVIYFMNIILTLSANPINSFQKAENCQPIYNNCDRNFDWVRSIQNITLVGFRRM